MDQQQPGQVIAPGLRTDEPIALPHNQPSQGGILPEPAVQQQPNLQQPEASQPLQVGPPQQLPQASQTPGSQETTENYVTQTQTNEYATLTNDGGFELSWSAAEPEVERKTFGWYALYILATVGIGAAIFLLTKDVLSSGVVLVAAIGLLSIVVHRPGEQSYALDDGHIAIGSKWYSLHDFKAFSIDADAHMAEVLLLPLKRFMPPLTLYLDQAHYEAVVQYLSGYIAQEAHTADAVERFIRRLRF